MKRPRPPRQRRLLTKGQLAMAGTLLLLLLAMGAVVVLAYININTAGSFQSGYVLTNLANVEREIIELRMETDRVLRDRSRNFEMLDVRRAGLDKDLQLAIAEAAGDARLTSSLRSLDSLAMQYDGEIGRLSLNPTEQQFRSSAYQLDGILDMMQRQIDTLYTNKEMEFYHNIDGALELQRTSQTLTVSIGGLLLLFGVLLVMSVGRSVSGEFERAYDMLKEEVTERRRAEEELRQQNEYLAAFHETSLALMNRLESKDLLEAIVARAAQMLGTEHGYVYLVNPAKEVIQRKVGVGFFSRSIGFGLQCGEGLAGRVWASGQPLTVNDYPRWHHRAPTPGVRAHEIKAVLGVPLKSGQEIVGVLGIAYHRDSGRIFGDREVTLLEGFAQLASIALDNARLFSDAEQRALQIEALYRADQELYRHLDLDEVLTTLVNVAVDILQVDKSSLLVWDERREHLLPKAARGFRDETLARMSFDRAEGLVGQVAATGKPVMVGDTTVDRRVDRHVTFPERIRSFIHVPVIVDDEVFGIFNVNYTEPHAFTDADLRLVLALAQRAASAIQNARLYEQAQQAATLEERQRLARELHDAVTQTLFSASIIADVLPRLSEKHPDEAIRRVDELRELTRGALAEMRTLLLELRPTALSETPLDELLHQLGEATVGRARVPVAVDARADTPGLPLDVKVTFYRIAQEALNNIAKHANAQQVHVTLRCTEAEVRLSICDDGVGFDTHHLRPDNMGLRIMRERAQAIGAVLDVAGRPGDGTDIVVTWHPPAVSPPSDAPKADALDAGSGASGRTHGATSPVPVRSKNTG